MKKIDLHIHTVATISDSHFDFSLQKLKEYVESASLDVIAITNHNTFDLTQFRIIDRELSITVLPGIEVNLEDCHVLLITDFPNIAKVANSSGHLRELIKEPSDCISTKKMIEIFGNLSDYLMIPHYEKNPSIHPETLSKLVGHVMAGEVDSVKKFIRCIKDDNGLVPVLFSDTRISDDLVRLPSRSTFIDCGEITLTAIRACLQDKNKVFLSQDDGNKLFQVLDDGLMTSTGLNVLLGDRSTGKTFTLNRIEAEQCNVKYIEQFSLVQLDEAKYERDFNSELERRRSRFTDEYLNGFRAILDDVMAIDLAANDRSLEKYMGTLIRSAEEADRADSFSKAALFSETTFKFSDDKSLKSLIDAVRHLIENVDYREVIQRHLDPGALRALACELIDTLWERSLERSKHLFVNRIVQDIKQNLGVRSSAVQVEDVDLYELMMDKKKIDRFEEIVRSLRSEHIIYEDDMQDFKVVAKKSAHSGAGDLKSTSGKKIAFKDAMACYGRPYDFLRVLLSMGEIPDSELYRYFVKIGYEILNKDGFPVSGGERSEYRLLQEISDAQNYDILLIDEPESSFDNLFLKSDVNSLIRDISKTMPVVVVTHNNTVGATIGPDYVLYASKEADGDKIKYKIYRGYPTDKRLACNDGTSIANHKILMDSLEAGTDAYKSRRMKYEAIEDR